jgi:hypothetical protein
VTDAFVTLQRIRFWALIAAVWLVALASPGLVRSNPAPPVYLWLLIAACYGLVVIFARDAGNGRIGSRYFQAGAPLIICAASNVLYQTGLYRLVAGWVAHAV